MVYLFNTLQSENFSQLTGAKTILISSRNTKVLNTCPLLILFRPPPVIPQLFWSADFHTSETH